MKIREEDILKYTQIRKRRNKDVRNELYANDPYCFYCGVFTRNDVPEMRRNLEKGESLPDDTATLEHLYHRFDARRYDTSVPDDQKKVIACYKCNQDKSKEVGRVLMKNGDRDMRRKIQQDLENRPRTKPRMLAYIDLIEG